MSMFKGSNSPPRNQEPRQDLPPLSLIMKSEPQQKVISHIVTSANLQLPNLPASDVYSAFHHQGVSYLENNDLFPLFTPPLFLMTHHILHSDSTITAHNVVYFYRSDLLGRMYHILDNLSAFQTCLHILPFKLNNYSSTCTGGV